MNDRHQWTTTTHVWAWDVDREHLADMRRELSAGGAAGGRRHLILEVLAYAQDEAASRGATGRVVVTHHPDGTVSVDDDGRGTDTRIDDAGHVVRKPVMATADVRFTDPGSAPVLPDGLPRRGMSSVAAISSVLVHTNHRADGSWSQTYRHGIPDQDLHAVDPRGHSGTIVTFHCDLDGPGQLTLEDQRAFPNLLIRVR